MKFDIGTILSISHPHLLTKMENIYLILNYMLSDDLFTHQLPRAGRFCEKFIRAQYPQLDKWDEFDKSITTENWREFLNKAEMMFGKELEIDKVPDGVWTYKNPIDEAGEFFGSNNIIAVGR